MLLHFQFWTLARRTCRWGHSPREQSCRFTLRRGTLSGAFRSHPIPPYHRHIDRIALAVLFLSSDFSSHLRIVSLCPGRAPRRLAVTGAASHLQISNQRPSTRRPLGPCGIKSKDFQRTKPLNPKHNAPKLCSEIFSYIRSPLNPSAVRTPCLDPQESQAMNLAYRPRPQSNRARLGKELTDGGVSAVEDRPSTAPVWSAVRESER
jgi:hypothetical protein